MKEIGEVFLKSFSSIIVLFIMTKIMGRKQISQLSLFDYIIGISIGSIASEMATGTDEPWYHFLIAIVVYTAVSVIIAIVTMKSIWIRKFCEGPLLLLYKMER